MSGLLFPFHILFSQLMAAAVVAGALIVVQTGRLFHPRYRGAVLFELGSALLLQLVFPLTLVQYYEDLREWKLKQDGVRTIARVLESRRVTHRSRYGGHASGYTYEVLCEFSDASGKQFQGTVLEQALPANGTVVVIYDPADPTLVREEGSVVVARPPRGEWALIGLPWIGNVLIAVFFWLRALRAAGRRPSINPRAS